MSLTAVKIEGSLVFPDIETQIAELPGQKVQDFGFSKNINLTDEIASCWSYAKSCWSTFKLARQRHGDDSKITTVTREQWVLPLLRELGYDPVFIREAQIVNGKSYQISYRADQNPDSPPVHIVAANQNLKDKPENSKYFPHTLIQNYLNDHEHLWALLTNGYQFRLLRDCSLMSRLSYIEFDLEQIIENENFAEFTLFYRLFHRTRLPVTYEDAGECMLEQYHQQAVSQGGRVRDKLRDGVEEAIKVLGQGLVSNPKNHELRELVKNKNITSGEYYRNLLLLIYRFLFVMVAESRNLLFASKNKSDINKKQIYDAYYSIERLRRIVDKGFSNKDKFVDSWEGLKITFTLFNGSSVGIFNKKGGIV
jgi:hypothetical protein